MMWPLMRCNEVRAWRVLDKIGLEIILPFSNSFLLEEEILPFSNSYCPKIGRKELLRPNTIPWQVYQWKWFKETGNNDFHGQKYPEMLVL